MILADYMLISHSVPEGILWEALHATEFYREVIEGEFSISFDHVQEISSPQMPGVKVGSLLITHLPVVCSTIACTDVNA